MEQNHPNLSEREHQLIRLAAHGHTDTSIAHRLGISEATVSTYWGRIRTKLGPHSRTELVAMALKEEHKQAIESLRLQVMELQQELRVRFGINNDLQSNFYKELVEEAPDAILLVRSDGIIESANAATEVVFGYTPSEIVGRHLQELLPERYRKVHQMHVAEYMTNPEKKPMGDHLATLAQRKDGTEFPIAASISPIHTETGVVVICIARDVSTNRKQPNTAKAAS